jgi:isoleucyl-tRNA synthetase
LARGKRVLLVSHQKRFRVVWKHLFGLETDIVEDTDLKKPYALANTEIVKLPTIILSNELDQRILAEVYATITAVDSHMQTYELEPAVRSLMAFMDKLTNWYLRRSRRRFRAEGMDADKQAAYWTLYEVIGLYAKIAAPFTPFVSEWVWQEMQTFRAKSEEQRAKSVHLEYWPLVSDKYINTELIEEIATVRKIIK